MPLERFYTKTATINRMVYTGDKSALTLVTTQKGALRALDEVESSANGFQFGQAHALQVPVNTDIKEGDEVVIDGVKYQVQGVATHDRGLSVDHKRALLTLGQT